MSPSSHRALRVAGFVIVVLLVGLAFYSGTVASPYVAEDSYHHQVVPETAAAYNETFEQAPTYRYSELSPIARTFVDRTRATPDGKYTPTVCQAFVLTCDAYTQAEFPEEFTYGKEILEEDAYAVIEDGDEQFLLQTGRVNHGWFALPVRFLTSWLLVLPLAGVVGVITFRSDNERVLGGAVGVGAVVAGLAVAAPYIEMYGMLAAQTTGFLLVGGVWIGLLATGAYKIAQRL
jgi:hypothetical protein